MNVPRTHESDVVGGVVPWTRGLSVEVDETVGAFVGATGFACMGVEVGDTVGALVGRATGGVVCMGAKSGDTVGALVGTDVATIETGAAVEFA